MAKALKWDAFSGGVTTKKKSYQAITDHLPGGRSMFTVDPVTTAGGSPAGYALRSFGIVEPHWTIHRYFNHPQAAKKFARHIVEAQSKGE